MHIYIEKTGEIESRLQTLSDQLYGGVHADKGLTDFYYAFTPMKDRCEITFEVLGTDQQTAFLKLIDENFDIVGVEPSEGGEKEEREALDWWQAVHDAPGRGGGE